MGLILPQGPSWGYCTSNLTGATASATPGTAMTPGATNNDGSVADLCGAAVAHDVEYMVLGFAGEFVSGQNTASLADILIDPAGGTSWDTTNIPINDLIMGHKVAMAAGISCPIWYHFPIWFPSGCRFGVRARCAYGTPIASRVLFAVYGGNKNPASWWCGQSVESIAVAPATSRGTAFTPANSGTAWSGISWANIGSTQVGPGGAVQFGLQTIQGTETAIQYLIEFGIGSQRIGPTIHFTGQTSKSGIMAGAYGPIFCRTPDAAQWQVRGLASGTAQALDGAIYVIH